ncbi:hypothetical protein QQP08_008867, partial [Theobroma cacao]
TAFEYEKAMEQNLLCMACQVKKLRAEQMNADSRAHGPGGYGTMGGNPEMRYPGRAFAEGYHGGWRPNSNCDPPRR